MLKFYLFIKKSLDNVLVILEHYFCYFFFVFFCHNRLLNIFKKRFFLSEIRKPSPNNGSGPEETGYSKKKVANHAGLPGVAAGCSDAQCVLNWCKRTSKEALWSIVEI